MRWKKGRGKLGIIEPLLGTWVAEAESDMGPVQCTRTFARILDEKYVEVRVFWRSEKNSYEELGVMGFDNDDKMRLWLFSSQEVYYAGVLTDATDVSPHALAMTAKMPNGDLVRHVYWPHSDVGFQWVLELRNKGGWKRYMQHHYKPVK